MYGGQNAANVPTLFDEIWLLSLPSFTWIKVYAEYSSKAPRIAHTCHLVGNRTMLPVGGIVDERESSGQLTLCDFLTGGISSSYDMSDLVWTYGTGGFNATTPAYEVPDPLISIIGGRYVVAREAEQVSTSDC